MIVERNQHDVDIIMDVVRRYGGSPLYKRIDDIATLASELGSRPWDLILCSYAVAQISNVQILRVTRDIKSYRIPLIIFYDNISEEDAANLISFGAQDCVPRRDFHRLMIAIKRGIDAAEARYKEAQIEYSVQSERDLLRQIMANMPDIIIFKDMQCRYTHVNQTVCRLFNRAENEIVGSTRDVFSIFRETSGIREVEEKVLATGEPDIHRLEKLVLEGGSVRWHESTRSPILDSRGAITGLMVVSRDITDKIKDSDESKKIADRYRRVLDLAADAIIASDEKHHILVFNKGAENIFGYKAHEVIGQPLDILLPSRFRGDHGKRVAKFGGSSDPSRSMAARCQVYGRHKNGEEFPAEATISKYDDEGKRNYIAVVRDVTVRRQLEERLAQSQKMEEVGLLAGGVAHDFNNLLMVVIGNLELLKEMEIPSEEAVELVEASLAAAMSGADLSKSLLAFSRQQVLRPEETDIGALIVDHVKLLTRLVGPNILVKTAVEDGVYSTIVDPSQLRSVLTNLIVNARDAMPESGLLNVRTYNAVLGAKDVQGFDGVEPGDYVVMEVADTGTGIPPEALQRIYEPFFSTKEVGKGTGLGLSTVFGFVKQSKGKISVESEVGKGTVFKLFLPRAGAPAAKKAEIDIKPATVRAGATILVVDDDLAVRETVVALLASFGYNTIEAGGAAEALAIIDKNEPFDLLFTDIVMPGGVSGIDLARMARERKHDLKVLLTSGFPDLKKQHEDDEKNADPILGKPYRRGELQQMICKMIADA